MWSWLKENHPIIYEVIQWTILGMSAIATGISVVILIIKGQYYRFINFILLLRNEVEIVKLDGNEIAAKILQRHEDAICDTNKKIEQLKMEIDDLTKSNRLLRICINLTSVTILILVVGDIIA